MDSRRFLYRSLLAAALSAGPGCIAINPFYNLDLGSKPADPHAWYQSLPLPDGSLVRLGVDTGYFRWTRKERASKAEKIEPPSPKQIGLGLQAEADHDPFHQFGIL